MKIQKAYRKAVNYYTTEEENYFSTMYSTVREILKNSNSEADILTKKRKSRLSR